MIKFFLGLIFLIPFVLWQGFCLLLQEGLRSSNKAIVTIQQNKEGLWRLQRKDGQEIYARAGSSSVRSSWLTVLTLETIPLKKTIRLVIPIDAMSKEQYQVLTARLWT